jgi:cytochrome c oxidase assembly protein subunit 15
LALVKGCLGPLFFGLVVALAAMTSDEWREREMVQSDPAVSGKLHRLAWLTLGLTYLQLVIGAYLRHVPYYAEPASFQIAIWFHVLIALAIVVHVGLVAWHVWSHYRGEPALAGPAAWMAGLIAAQIALGLSTWVVKYGFPEFLGDWAPAGHVNVAGGFWQTHIVTAHVAVGSLILAQALRLGLWSQRLLPLAAKEATPSPEADSKSPDHELRAGLAGVTP